MGAQNRHHGKNGRIFMAIDGVSEPVLVQSMAEWSLDTEPDRVDTTCQGDGNKTSVQGYPSCKGTFSGQWDDTEETLWAAAKSSNGTTMIIYPDYDKTDHYAKGPAWVSASISGSATDSVKVSGSYEANGTWILAL
jgi:hypothetical protein